MTFSPDAFTGPLYSNLSSPTTAPLDVAGPTWPATDTTLRFTAVCWLSTNPAVTVTSDPVSAVWPAHASPSPSGT